ncbi:MAG: DUF4153 domain-containing protein [Eubacteriaceae bacterium]
MEKLLKIKLLLYLLVSAFSFIYLILLELPGLSVPIFILIQFIALFFLIPKKKPLFTFIPIFILGLNSFISGNNIWRLSNFIIITLLYSVMLMIADKNFTFKDTTLKFMGTLSKNVIRPFSFFIIPIQWIRSITNGRTQRLLMILSGIAISIPCLLAIILLLSSADQIFAKSVSKIYLGLGSSLDFLSLIKIPLGFLIGFYLFGIIYSIYQPKPFQNTVATFEPKKKKDLTIINIVLCSILIVYTLFAVIQFKYLFANSNSLPYGLTYTDYARRGFFELLFLSGINLLLIFLTLKLSGNNTSFWAKCSKVFSSYLCLITFMLLGSSFYRMWLYNQDNGLTRLRFLVLGFLIFEAIGLVFTFIYIMKPKFNIIAVYLCISLSYYLVLNIIPIDSIIAKNQIDRYFETGKGDLDYTLSLSTDAASQISRLLQSPDKNVRIEAENYFAYNTKTSDDHDSQWQQINLSVEKCRLIYQTNLKNNLNVNENYFTPSSNLIYYPKQ